MPSLSRAIDEVPVVATSYGRNRSDDVDANAPFICHPFSASNSHTVDEHRLGSRHQDFAIPARRQIGSAPGLPSGQSNCKAPAAVSIPDYAVGVSMDILAGKLQRFAQKAAR
jgi:hypothetical protein